jgi:enoyl-[acyl-carrier protein] reductase/trans-2-enoyl-CoA reductase (NAD+)
MATIVISPRFRSFLSLTAHPTGCAANVVRQVKHARTTSGTKMENVLVVGSSAGYGLASLITTLFIHNAKALSVCFERPGAGEKAGSAGWYNLAEVHRQAKADGRLLETINADAFTTATKQQAIAALKARFGKIDALVYSLASPRRTDPTTGTVFSSTLKPIGQAYTSKTVNLDSDQVTQITIPPASEAEIRSTVKVMGGEDWTYWVQALIDADLLADGFRTVAYSYIGPQLTHSIYTAGTIGRAKADLERTATDLSTLLAQRGGGAAYVSVNKALVTTASSAIPVVPLYISLLYKVMKARGSHEGTIEQIMRLYAEHLAPGKTPTLDAAGRIRIDDREMDPGVQDEVSRLWPVVTSENLSQVSDWAGFKGEFRQLYGFDMPGVDYAQAVETEVALS